MELFCHGYRSLMTPDFGDVPTWLATAGAGAAAFFAYGAYQIESRRDAAQASRLKQEQATSIAIWPEQLANPYTDAPGELECFRLRNASPLPVHDVRVFAYGYEWPDVDHVQPAAYFDVGTVPPSDKPSVRYVEISPAVTYVYALQFRDAGGNTWHRDRFGVLVEGPLSTEGFAKKVLLTREDL